MKSFDRLADRRGTACDGLRRRHHHRRAAQKPDAFRSRESVCRCARLRFDPSRARDDFRQRHAARCRFHQRAENFFPRAVFQDAEKRRYRRIFAFVPRRTRVQHRAAPNRHHRRIPPQNETIARKQQQRFIEPQLRERRAARREFAVGVSQQNHFRNCLRRALMKMHARAIFQRRRGTQQRDARIHPLGRVE